MAATRHRAELGAAAIEAAITLPLTIFLILGCLQLFLAFQGRFLAQYAVSRASHSGSVNFGDCESMTHSALLALLPSYSSFLGTGTPGGTPAQKLAAAFSARKDNLYSAGMDGGHDRAIVWLFPAYPAGARNDNTFDVPTLPSNLLELRMIYWYPLRIPFANWVWSAASLAQRGVMPRTNLADPLIPVKAESNWLAGPPTTIPAAVTAEMRNRHLVKQYVMPIEVTYVTRMMSPTRVSTCPNSPGSL